MALSTSITLTVSDYDIKMSRSLKFYKNDALKLIFTINYWGIDNANGVPQRVLMPLEALSAILFMETPDGTDSVEAGAVEGNVVTFYLDSEYTQNVGVSRMQIRLFDDDGCAITLPEFPFEIRENIYGGTDVNFSNVVLMDSDGTAIVTEDLSQIDVGDVFLYGVEPVKAENFKEISDLELVETLDGNEDLIIQLSDGSTKRTKTSEFLNVSIDLTGYATKDELSAKADISSIPTNTSQLTNDSGFITSVPSEYITETELNAKGYLTEHQDISGKADKTYVDTELAKKANMSHTHSYNDLTDKPVIPSVDNLATKEELTNGLATKANVSHTHDQYLTEHQDLSDYALKTEIPTVPTNTSELTNDSGFITSIPSEYVTETELNTGLSSYQTKTDNTLTTTSKTVVGAINELNRIKIVALTQSEYDGLSTKDSNTVYLITG